MVPACTKSRVARGKDVSWEEVMAHEAIRLKWTDPALSMLVFTDGMVKVPPLFAKQALLDTYAHSCMQLLLEQSARALCKGDKHTCFKIHVGDAVWKSYLGSAICDRVLERPPLPKCVSLGLFMEGVKSFIWAGEGHATGCRGESCF